MKPHRFYIAIDGDDVGERLRELIIANNIEGAASLSGQIVNYFNEISTQFVNRGCTPIFCAGDSVLLVSEAYFDVWFSEIPAGPCTISVGIGESAEYAYLALQLAKARGKKQVVKLSGTVAQTVHKWNSTTD